MPIVHDPSNGQFTSGGGGTAHNTAHGGYHEASDAVLKAHHSVTPSPDVVKAIKTYTGHSYVPINNDLRSGKISPEHSDTVKKIDDHLRAHPLKQDVMLFRGFAASPDRARAMVPGHEFIDHGFVSSSAKKDVGKGFAQDGALFNPGKKAVLVHIEAPEGAHAAYVEGHTASRTEHEVIVARGSRFHITHRWEEDGVIHVRAKLKQEHL